MENNLGKKIMEQIQNSNIKPITRRHFLLKHSLVWLLGALALVGAAVALSVMLYFYQFNDLALRTEIDKNLVQMLILTTPYLWLVFLGIFVYIVYRNIKKTKHGYRYPLWMIAAGAISASVFLGAIFAVAGLGEKLDGALVQEIPDYGRVMNPHLGFWSNPDEGRLMGVIENVIKDNFTLIDMDRKRWVVETADLNNDFEKELIAIGEPIRVLGEIKSDDKFTAEKILPLQPGRGFIKRLNDPNFVPGRFRGGHGPGSGMGQRMKKINSPAY